MGPERSNAPTKLLEAPSLNHQTDKFQYRKDARMWIRRVRAFASGGDNRAKGVFNGLVYAMLASMEAIYAKIVESAIEKTSLKIGHDDGSNLTKDE